MSYPGGKAGAGVYQTIINLMPPHELYVEPFVGGGAILLKKRPARASIVIDSDADVAARWQRCSGQGRFADLTAIHGDALTVLPELKLDRVGTLIYADPPYVRSARRDSTRAIYRHELTDLDHRELLNYLLSLRHAAVMLSGYRCPLYDDALKHWRRVDFSAMTRGGRPAVESLWINYAPPRSLHDYGYLGRNFRERERIKRKKARWRRRLATMGELERGAILTVLLELASPRPARSRGDEDLKAPAPLAANDDAGSLPARRGR